MEMFIVLKKSCDGNENAIGFIYNENNFKNFVENYVKDYSPIFIDTSDANNTNYPVDINSINSDEKYKDSYYLIKTNENKLILLNKYKVVSKGFFYNSLVPTTNIECTFKCIKFNSENCDETNKSKSNEISFLDYNLFDPKDIKDSLVGIIGNIKTGKTCMIFNILKSKDEGYLNDSLIITNKKNFEKYKLLSSNIKLSTDFNHKIIKEYLDKKNGCIVVDGIMVPKRIRGTIWDRLFFGSEKLRIISAINDMIFHPKVRRKMSYLFYLKEKNDKKCNRIWNNYGKKVFETKEEFKLIFNQMCENYGAMVFENTNQNNKYNVYRSYGINIIGKNKVKKD